MNTNIATYSGTYDAATKTFEYRGAMEMPDGTTWTTRQVFKIESKDKLTETQYSTPPGGKEMMTVAMTYTRKAEAPKPEK